MYKCYEYNNQVEYACLNNKAYNTWFLLLTFEIRLGHVTLITVTTNTYCKVLPIDW